MTAFFCVETVFVTLFGYPMSYLELTGTVFNLWSVWLVAPEEHPDLAGRRRRRDPVRDPLLPDPALLRPGRVTGFYGWWIWGRAGTRVGDRAVPTTRSGAAGVVASLAIVAGVTVVMGYLMAHVHRHLPELFPQPASFPYLDAFTTAMSFVATILMAHKKVECWYLWIAVDVIGIGLYFAKGVVFVALLYLVFLVLATRGLLTWRRDLP